MIARRVRVHGRVQGVGFRDAMVQTAMGSGACGWVRNRRDGSVEAWVQGDDFAVERVLAWARQGPRHARVDRLEVETVEVDSALAGFRRLPDA